jgi:hypothetical protein
MIARKPLSQTTLPGFEELRVPETARHASEPPAAPLATANGDGPSAEPGASIPGDEQLWLFSGPAALLRDLESALRAGDFAAAVVARRSLESEYGGSPLTRGLASLDRLAAAWPASAGEALDLWIEIDAALAEHGWVRRLVRAAVFARLLLTHAPEQLASERPALLGVLSNTLQLTGEGRRAARALVRDALLAGHVLDPVEFDDPLVRDLLAEDREPAWIACAGAIRRAWPVRAPAANDLIAFEDWITRPQAPAPPEAPLVFWLCLAVAESEPPDTERVLEARKAMRCLDGDLHAAYMSRLRPSRF